MLLVFCSFPDGETAAETVRTLVTEKLAACGSIIPGVRSIYAWEGKIEDNAEVMVLLKTSGPLYARLEKRLARLHPYETPEIVAFEAGAVAKPYAAWLASSFAGS
jgi:periplasmic divalent cation tolerance protein